MATQPAAGQAWSHIKGAGTTFAQTIPAAAASSRVVLFCAGGAVPQTVTLTASGTPLSRRTGPYVSGAQDASIWDGVAVGGETSLTITLSGDDNIGGYIYQFGAGTSFVGASNAGTGVAADVSLDYQVRPSAVTATGPSLVVAGFSATSSVAYGTGNTWRQLGPLGHIYGSGGVQPSNGGVNFVWMSGLMDVDAAHSYPQQFAAGQYQASSVWLGAGSCFAVQAIYADTSSMPTNPLPTNTIVRENSLPGTHQSHWSLGTAGTNPTIAGYCDAASYLPGQTVNMKVDSTGHAFRAEIYRLGYYGFESFGARNMLGCQGGYIAGTVVTQPTPTVDPVLGSTSCAWTTNAQWTIPADAAPGFYYALWRRTDDTTQVASGHFIVSGPTTGKVAVCLPDMTYQAYNLWGSTTDHGDRSTGSYTGGRSLYQAATDGATPNFAHRGYAVSFDRPYATQSMQDSTYVFDSEHGWIVFAEAQGYDLTYLSNLDLDANTAALIGAKAVVMLGHHEYWTQPVYDAFDAARDNAVNMLVVSSNTALWRTRFGSADVNRRTMICYKDSSSVDVSPGFDAGTGLDPVGYTGSWRDGRLGAAFFNPDVRRENALTGQIFVGSGPIQQVVSVPAAAKTLPIWRNSSAIQALATGAAYATTVHALGYEADYPDGSASQPPNLVNLNPYTSSFTTGANSAGTVYATNTGTITLGYTLYRANSGALVCNTGSWRGWWGVSRWQGSTFAGNSVDPNWQHALLCIMRDLGVAPVAPREMQPGIDTPLTDPAVGAPAAGQVSVARAYGLKVPAPGFLSFFL